MLCSSEYTRYTPYRNGHNFPEKVLQNWSSSYGTSLPVAVPPAVRRNAYQYIPECDKRVLRENDYETDELEERVEEILQGM